MQKEYKVKEIYNTNEKNIEEKLQEVFVSFLSEKLIDRQQKSSK